MSSVTAYLGRASSLSRAAAACHAKGGQPTLATPDTGVGGSRYGIGAQGAMQIVVNGECRVVPAGWTVADLVSQLGLELRHVAVELNREVLPRKEYASQSLEAGDALELVTLVGGG